ncbi:MAG: two-component system sensor histidine kinase NtrB [bacterium]
MQPEAIPSKLKVLIAFRVFFVTVLLAVFFVLRLDYRFFPHPQFILFLIVAIYVMNIFYLLLRQTGTRAPIQAYIQLVMDAVIVVMLILATGGIESWFTSTLLIVVISSSIILNKKAGFIIATVAGILYGITIDLQYYGIIPVAYSSNLTEKNFFYNIVINLFAVYLTAYLTGYLVSGLEKTKKTLDERSTDLTHLSLFHRDVIENIPSGLFYADLLGNIRLFNRAAEQISGIPREQAVNLGVTAIFPFVDFPLAPRRYNGIVEQNDRKKHIGMSISIHLDSDGRDQGYIGTFQDLTDIVRLEAEIKRKEKFAVIGELSANIAHEIRNPLASIKGSIEMIREGKLRETDKAKLMNIALNEMTRLNNIITNFLSYSNPKPLSFQRQDVSTLLRNTVTLLKSSVANVPGIRFREDMQSPLPGDVDEERMRQVFWNLLTNAVQAIKGEGSISLKLWKAHDEIILEISDTGEGIRAQDMERIFYPFYTTKKSGTGLGLAIAYRIIEEHHGSIDVKSIEGKGATFTIKIPVTNSESAEKPPRYDSGPRDGKITRH